MPRRPGAAVAALALNAGIGAALILCFRMPVAPDSRVAVAKLIWMPEPAWRPKRTEPRESRTTRSMASKVGRSATVLSPVVPEPTLPGTPSAAFEAARVTRTICPGNSNTVRGDLFKDLPGTVNIGRNRLDALTG